MESKSPGGGFDELTRLSQQTSKMEQELTRKEQQLAKKAQEAAERRQIVQGLKEINLSVALEQLKTLAAPEIIAEVNSLRNKRGNDDLRKLILDLAAELEENLDRMARTNPDMVSMKRSVKTLTILIELLFSVE